jgi:hypothetical protein
LPIAPLLSLCPTKPSLSLFNFARKPSLS